MNMSAVTITDRAADLVGELTGFCEFGAPSEVREMQSHDGTVVPVLINEFWTAKQRAAHPLHEVSYRACFKPALPRFFIERLTKPGAMVYDPFMGRGTTLIEAMLHGRRAGGCDISPVARVLVEPRINPPDLSEVQTRLDSIPLTWEGEVRADLEVFYHPDTLREITALRAYLFDREATGKIDTIDRWIRMVAVNRLTGHSKGFLSVYTLPPNQAVTIESQRRINRQREQVPDYRSVRGSVLKKSRQLLSEVLPLSSLAVCMNPVLVTGSCDDTPQLADASVDLVVTSPPFLDVVDYTTDNWLRGWFCGVDTRSVPVWQLKKIEDWSAAMLRVMRELRRVLRKGAWLAFEVGEVRGGKVRLEEQVVETGLAAGLTPVLVLINQQEFTKTANCWGVTNAKKGTNSNRVVLFQKR